MKYWVEIFSIVAPVLDVPTSSYLSAVSGPAGAFLLSVFVAMPSPYVLCAVLQVYNLSHNIQEDDLQDLQVSTA